MPAATDWRSVTQYLYLTRLDRPGFAWEFLRRNVAYQDDYNRSMREAAADADFEARSTEGLVRRWGLSFHGRSATDRCSSNSILGPGSSAHCRSAGSDEHRGAPARSQSTSLAAELSNVSVPTDATSSRGWTAAICVFC